MTVDAERSVICHAPEDRENLAFSTSVSSALCLTGLAFADGERPSYVQSMVGLWTPEYMGDRDIHILLARREEALALADIERERLERYERQEKDWERLVTELVTAWDDQKPISHILDRFREAIK